jgi:hypothetical protein
MLNLLASILLKMPFEMFNSGWKAWVQHVVLVVLKVPEGLGLWLHGRKFVAQPVSDGELDRYPNFVVFLECSTKQRVTHRHQEVVMNITLVSVTSFHQKANKKETVHYVCVSMNFGPNLKVSISLISVVTPPPWQGISRFFRSTTVKLSTSLFSSQGNSHVSWLPE